MASKTTTATKTTTAKPKANSSMMDKLRARADSAPTTAEREIYIPLEKLRFDPTQPRKTYHTLDGRIAEKDEAYIIELAATIKSQGLIQAITVEELPDGTYLIRVGECRTRAHLYLGEKTIRAVINNNLQTRTKRLLYQVTENLTRKDLSDFELAGAIKELMEGDAEEPPLSQTEVAAAFGKSEGWVTRFVVFADDELQRRWVQTGIADTAEKLYRLKLLPPHIQLEVLRRVDLPAEHPEYLEKPLLRSAIDDFAVKAKMEKQRNRETKGDSKLAPESVRTPGAAFAAAPPASPANKAAPEARATGKPRDNDTIGQALAEAATQGRGATAAATSPATTPAASDGYKLSEDLRQQLLLNAQSGAASAGDKHGRAADAAPVNCRVLVSNLEALLPLLRTAPEVLKAMRGVRCEVTIPSELAKSLATALVGVQVDEQELAATVQAELGKLG